MTYIIISAKRLSNGAGGSDLFTKAGQIRSNCDVKHFDGTAQEMKDHLDAIKYQATGKPYIFSHIEGRDLFGNRSIIKQSVNGFSTSPVELAELLGL